MDRPPRADKPKEPLAQVALRWSLLGILLLAITLRHNVFLPTLNGLRLSASIVERSRLYHEQIRENAILQHNIDFLKTEQGKRWAARRYTNMVEPGETVGQAVESTPAPAKPLRSPERLQQWIAEQGVRSAESLHGVGEVVRCYAGLRTPDRPPKKSNQKPKPLSNKPTANGGTSHKSPKPEPNTQDGRQKSG
jgi:hypothetical protein